MDNVPFEPDFFPNTFPKESLDKHTEEKHAAVNCENCDYNSDSNAHLIEQIKEHHTIEQLNGLTKLKTSGKKIEHDELWCHKCEEEEEEEEGECQGWEFSLNPIDLQ